ncbi:MAG: lamin tail domain-containing protein, partial [Myxococcota bacterium]
RLQLIEQNSDRTELTLFLAAPKQGCERLQPNTHYRLVFTQQLTGDSGLAMQEQTVAFSTAGSCSTKPHVLLSAVATVAMPNSATLRFSSNKPSSSQAWFGLTQQKLGCLGQLCPAAGKPAKLQPAQNDNTQPQFMHKIHLTGLQLGKTYHFVVAAQDANGQVAMHSGSFTTKALPQIAINEIMINPQVPATSVEWEAEFMELLNYGNQPINLQGYAIALLDEDNDPIRSCPIPQLPAGQLLQPNTPLLLAGKRFDPTHYPNLPNWKIHRMSSSQLCGSLSNAGTQTLALQDPQGRIVSSYSGHIAKPEEGFSIERTAPNAPDQAGSFCLSPSINGATPGLRNEATEQDCMPLQ